METARKLLSLLSEIIDAEASGSYRDDGTGGMQRGHVIKISSRRRRALTSCVSHQRRNETDQRRVSTEDS